MDGQLTRDKNHRWGAVEVRAWLRGESPKVHDSGPAPEQEPLQALTEMTPVGKVPLPELPHDYFLCHPDYEPHCWQPKSVAHSWH